MDLAPVLVVIPTYNERENISRLIDSVLSQSPRIHVLVVDDNSPDKTAQILNEKTGPRVHLIVRREGKNGRGSAVREGFRWGLTNSTIGFGVFVEMDSDFSHRPSEIMSGIRSIDTHTQEEPVIVLGSRYLEDSKIVGWPLTRIIFSRLSNLLARTLIGNQVSDFTNGYRFYNPKAVELFLKAPQKHRGYIYLSEVLCELVRHHAKVEEFPTIFENRKAGVSNTTSKEAFAAFKGIFNIAFDHRLKQLGIRK